MRLKLLSLLIIAILFLGGCQSEESNQESTSDYDFSAVATKINAFIAEVEAVKGASYILVDKDSGIIHEAAFGNHTLETIVLIASTSKVPSSGIVMALVDDGLLALDDSLCNLTTWDCSKPGITMEQLISNTSGLPGLYSHGMPYIPHACEFDPTADLEDCAQTIYEADVGDDLAAPGSTFRYGGGQWQVAGGVAEIVSRKTWTELVNEHLVDPCNLEVFEYGNPFSNKPAWTGDPDSLVGQTNPVIEGGAISNLHDYAKILMMHLNNGMCGDNRVLSEASVLEMRVDRGTAAGGSAYGLGWWITASESASAPTLFTDPGMYGTLAWIDTERNYAGYLALETQSADGIALYSRIRPLIEAELDSHTD